MYTYICIHIYIYIYTYIHTRIYMYAFMLSRVSLLALVPTPQQYSVIYETRPDVIASLLHKVLYDFDLEVDLMYVPLFLPSLFLDFDLGSTCIRICFTHIHRCWFFPEIEVFVSNEPNYSESYFTWSETRALLASFRPTAGFTDDFDCDLGLTCDERFFIVTSHRYYRLVHSDAAGRFMCTLALFAPSPRSAARLARRVSEVRRPRARRPRVQRVRWRRVQRARPRPRQATPYSTLERPREDPSLRAPDQPVRLYSSLRYASTTAL